MASYEERLGKTLIRILPAKEGGYDGITIRAGQRSEILHDEDRERLLVRLRNEAGRLEPGYFGMDAAIARFLTFMPGGFEGERIRNERSYKLKAREALAAVLPAERAAKASREDADALRSAPVWINLLSLFESMRLKETIESPSGPAFLAAATRFAAGEYAAGIAGMAAAMKGHGHLSWPIATYFPFLWDPARHMFLKPEVTRDFAERTGHPFQYRYSSEVRPETYDALLELTADTKTALAGLHPADNIDVQSFIWVVGGYTDADLPEQSA
jgi:hypothetical protein